MVAAEAPMKSANNGSPTLLALLVIRAGVIGGGGGGGGGGTLRSGMRSLPLCLVCLGVRVRCKGSVVILCYLSIYLSCGNTDRNHFFFRVLSVLVFAFLGAPLPRIFALHPPPRVNHHNTTIPQGEGEPLDIGNALLLVLVDKVHVGPEPPHVLDGGLAGRVVFRQCRALQSLPQNLVARPYARRVECCVEDFCC